MKSFILTQYAKLKADKYINTHCGGKYTNKEAYQIGGIGIGKLRYDSGVDVVDQIDTEERFRANIEIFREGLGIYIRSLSYNYLLTISAAELTNITLVKQEDVLKTTEFSYTKRLMQWGLPYHYARVLLLDQEIIDTHESFLKIETVDDSFRFLVKRYNPA